MREPAAAADAFQTTSRAVVLAGWLFASVFFLYAFVLRVSPSVMVDDLMRDFAVGAAVLGNLSAVYFYAYAGVQIPVGVLIDRFGPRRLTAYACAMCAIGAMVFASADTIWQAYAGRLLVGLGCATSFVGALSVAALWFPQRFALLSGLTQMLGVLGGLIGQAPFGYAVQQVGWRDANWAVAIAGVGLALCLYLTVRDRHRGTEQAARPLLDGVKRALGNRQTWYAALFGAGMSGTMLAFGGLWGVPFLMEARGMAKPEAAALTSLLFLGWGVGAPLNGWLSDRFRRRRPLMLAGGILATGGIAFAVFFPTMPLWLLQIVLLLQGFGASSMVLSFAVAREHNPAWANSATIGVINCFVVGSGALLQPLLGLLLDMAWDGRMAGGIRVYTVETYVFALQVLPLSCFLTGLLPLVIRETPARRD